MMKSEDPIINAVAFYRDKMLATGATREVLVNELSGVNFPFPALRLANNFGPVPMRKVAQTLHPCFASDKTINAVWIDLVQAVLAHRVRDALDAFNVVFDKQMAIEAENLLDLPIIFLTLVGLHKGKLHINEREAVLRLPGYHLSFERQAWEAKNIRRRLREPIKINADAGVYPIGVQPRSSDEIGAIYTKLKQSLPQQSHHLTLLFAFVAASDDRRQRNLFDLFDIQWDRKRWPCDETFRMSLRLIQRSEHDPAEAVKIMVRAYAKQHQIQHFERKPSPYDWGRRESDRLMLLQIRSDYLDEYTSETEEDRRQQQEVRSLMDLQDMIRGI